MSTAKKNTATRREAAYRAKYQAKANLAPASLASKPKMAVALAATPKSAAELVASLNAIPGVKAHEVTLPLADQLLREKLDALRAAESHLEGKKSIASMLREKADKAGADYNEATNAVYDYESHVQAAVKEVGLLLAERHDIFEFDGWFYVPAGPGRYTRYSKPVVLS